MAMVFDHRVICRRWRREWTPTDGIGSGGLGYERGLGGGEVEGLPSSATFPPATAATQQVPAVLGDKFSQLDGGEWSYLRHIETR